MPARTVPVVCGMKLYHTGRIARTAVGRYREELFVGSHHVDNPETRNMAAALHLVQDCLYNCSEDGRIDLSTHDVVVPGEEGFADLIGEIGPYSEEEKETCRVYLRALREAIKEHLECVMNEHEEIRRWWLAVKRCRKMYILV